METKLAYSLKEAGVLVGLSPWSLRKMIDEGRLKRLYINRRVLIERAELERLIKSGRGR